MGPSSTCRCCPMVNSLRKIASRSKIVVSPTLMPSLYVYHRLLTIFNQIAIKGTPQMAIDKEAICLSKVYSCYYKCNLPLIYVLPALTRHLSILLVNILKLLACTHSADNLFQTLMVLWENENFLTSNLLRFFTSVKLCPLVILLHVCDAKVHLIIIIMGEHIISTTYHADSFSKVVGA